MRVQEIIDKLRENPKLVASIPIGDMPAMEFSCSIASDGAEVDSLVQERRELPDDLKEFWRYARSARLFEDVVYGQWGLEILPPERAAEVTRTAGSKRRNDFITGDIVIGKFIGDSDLLLIRCNPSESDFGQVIVATPLDGRSEWYYPSPTFGEFLDRYVQERGEKFWEKSTS